MNHCRSCSAPIIWATLPTGKRMPLNPEPDPERGNVRRAEGGSGAVLGAAQAAAERGNGRPLYLSHFATCPNRQQHRRAR